MGKNKKLIIIPAYNEQESILNTVTEIQQKVPDYDYIVVNDCSRDATGRICKENGILSTPEDCFSYMRELPEKNPQISIFDL